MIDDPLTGKMDIPTEPLALCMYRSESKSWCPVPRDGYILAHSCVKLSPHHDRSTHLCQCGYEWVPIDVKHVRGLQIGDHNVQHNTFNG